MSVFRGASGPFLESPHHYRMLGFIAACAAVQVAARFRVADVSGAGLPRLRLALGGQECISDADGLVAAPPLVPGAYRITVLSTSDAPGQRFLQPQGSLVVDELSAAEYADPADYPTITVYRTAELRVLVVDSADAALENFTVMLKAGDEVLSTSTDKLGYAFFSLSEEGKFRTGGKYDLEVEDPKKGYTQNGQDLKVEFSTSFYKVVMEKNSGDTGKTPSMIGVLGQPTTKQVFAFFDRNIT